MSTIHKIKTDARSLIPVPAMLGGQIGVIIKSNGSPVLGRHVMMTYGGRLISLDDPNETWRSGDIPDALVRLLQPGQNITIEVGR